MRIKIAAALAIVGLLFALPFAPLSLGPLPSMAQSPPATVTLPTTYWVNAGSGTVTITSTSNVLINYYASNTSPTNSTGGTTISLSANTPYYLTSAVLVWLQGNSPNTQVTVSATNPGGLVPNYSPPSPYGQSGTGISQPTGGSGILGWLSGIYQTLTGTATAPLSVANSNPATIYSFQQTVTLSAVALPSQVLVNGIVLTAKAANTGTIYIGPSGVTTGNGYPLTAGQSISYAVTNLSAIYMIGSNTTDVLAFTGN